MPNERAIPDKGLYDETLPRPLSVQHSVCRSYAVLNFVQVVIRAGPVWWSKVLPGRYWEERAEDFVTLKKKTSTSRGTTTRYIQKISREREIERRVESDGEKRSDAAIKENVL